MFEILLPERSPLIHQSQHQIPSFVNGRVFPINCTIKCQTGFRFNFSIASNQIHTPTFCKFCFIKVKSDKIKNL